VDSGKSRNGFLFRPRKSSPFSTKKDRIRFFLDFKAWKLFEEQALLNSSLDFPGESSSLVIEDVLLSTKTIQNICFLYEFGRVFDFTADFSKIKQLNSGISRTKAIFRFLMISTCRLWWPNCSKMFEKIC